MKKKTPRFYNVRVAFFCIFSIVSFAVYAEESTQKYELVMEANKDAAYAAFNKGIELERSNKPLKALDAYKQAIRLYPKHAEAYNNLAAIYMDLGMLDKAIAAYRNAIRIQPDFSVAYVNLGMAYYERGRYENAVAAFENGLSAYPTMRDPLYFLGRSFAHLNEYELAVETFNKVLEIDYEFYPAHFDVACAYMILNKFNPALYHFKKVLELAPRHEQAEKIMTIIQNIRLLDLDKLELRNEV